LNLQNHKAGRVERLAKAPSDGPSATIPFRVTQEGRFPVMNEGRPPVPSTMRRGQHRDAKHNQNPARDLDHR
jgi:hypothetical protein